MTRARSEGKRKGGRQPAADEAVEPEPAQQRYGDATLTAMAVAGLTRRSRTYRASAYVGASLVLALAALVVLDLNGVINLPLVEIGPPAEAEDRPRSSNGDDGIPAAERDRLRKKLLGGVDPPAPSAAPKAKMSRAERSTLLDIYGSKDKRERTMKLPEKGAIVAPNLPSGLTSEAIYKVIADNNASVSLCFADSARRGEKVEGKMDIEMTIGPAGDVLGATVPAGKLKNSAFASCVVRRMKSWRFPSFRGDAVTVVYPYVVSGF